MNTWKVIATALCILILILVAGYMQGCSTDNPSSSISIEQQTSDFDFLEIYKLVDKETGVEYLLVKKGVHQSLTPMYNADGTIKTEEVKQ